MQRTFEELGFDLGDNSYGHFTGEAEWDEHGDVIAIILENAGMSGKALSLNIQDLIRERIALRRKYGVGFLEQAEQDVSEHGRKWFLFQGLSDALQNVFAEDLEDERIANRSDAIARRSAGRA